MLDDGQGAEAVVFQFEYQHHRTAKYANVAYTIEHSCSGSNRPMIVVVHPLD